MENKINIGVIGAGYWGKNYIRNLYELGNLYFICDDNKNIIEEFNKQYPAIKTTNNYQDVLNYKNIDGVVIATPASSHYQVSKEFLFKGINVLTEKPLSLNLSEAEDLINISKKNNKILMIGHLLHYHPVFIEIKKIIDGSEIGEIKYLYSNRLSLGKIRLEENVLWSFAPHDISMILSVLKSMPIEVFATGGKHINKDIEDEVLINLSFENNIKGHIFVSWLHPYKKHELVIIGDKKMLVFDDTKDWDEKLLIYDYEINLSNNIPIPIKKEFVKVKIEKSEPLKNECIHFINCIKNNEKSVTDGEEGLKVLKVLYAAQESLNTNKIVKVKDMFTGDKKNYFVHESSYVDDGAIIGKNTKIWHFSHIMPGANIGDNCSIGQNVNIGSKAFIGNNVKIQNNISIYDDVIIEDDVFCGPSCVFTNVINPRSFIIRKDEYKKTVVRKGASIGANATIVCGHEIGKYAFIGAGSVVTKDVKPYTLMVGNPAKQIGWICKCGSTLNFINYAASCKCGNKYELDKGEQLIIKLEKG